MLSLDRWIENFEGYLDARIELAKYDIKEALVDVLSKAVIMLVMAVFAVSGLICLNFGLAFLLNHLLGYPFAGFFILTLFYGLLTWVVYLNRENENLKKKLELTFRTTLKQPKAENENVPNADADR